METDASGSNEDAGVTKGRRKEKACAPDQRKNKQPKGRGYDTEAPRERRPITRSKDLSPKDIANPVPRTDVPRRPRRMSRITARVTRMVAPPRTSVVPRNPQAKASRRQSGPNPERRRKRPNIMQWHVGTNRECTRSGVTQSIRSTGFQMPNTSILTTAQPRRNL